MGTHHRRYLVGRLSLAALLIWGAVDAHAQRRPVQPLPCPPSPLLFARVDVPRGSQVTFYSGTAGREFPAPVQVGLRPGYIYRVKLDQLPGRPGLALFPTIEVQGTLQLPPQLRAATYPAPIVFTEQDIVQVLSGAFVIKAIVLEDPERALPEPALAGPPIEIEMATDDLLAETKARGRLLAVVRLGGLALSDADAARGSVAGTIQFPGENVIGPAAAPPVLPCPGQMGYDPWLGPAPSDVECLKDGGDPTLRARLDANGQIFGLAPSDTVAAYTNGTGRHLTPSNRICICVPRFLVLRRAVATIPTKAIVGLGSAEGVSIEESIRNRAVSLALLQREHPEGFHGRERASVAIETIGLAVAIGRAQGVNVVGVVQQAASVTAACNEVPRPPEKPLVLRKWASAMSARVGDVVTIYLKYSNVGGRPITDVAVADSLTSRLEYLPGTAKTDRDAVFTTQPNEAGSMVLHWEVRGPLLPGDSGVVNFQVRVR